jgi:hypothetical protein
MTMSWITPSFSEGSGLGNRLFQLAAADTLSRRWGLLLQISKSYCPPGYHGSWKDFYSLFPHIPIYKTIDTSDAAIYEQPGSDPYRFTPPPALPPATKVITSGLFVATNYVDPAFEVDWNHAIPDSESLLRKWNLGSNSVFLHIRLGDFLAYPQYQVCLNWYYAIAMASFCLDTTFYIFSNDLDRAKALPIFQDYSCIFVDEPNDVRTLFLMSHCQRGGITANSTFSWWGAFFGQKQWTGYTAFMPETWLTTQETTDILPEWATLLKNY